MAAGDAVARLHDGHVIEAAAIQFARRRQAGDTCADDADLMVRRRRLSDAAGLLYQPAVIERQIGRVWITAAPGAGGMQFCAAASCAARCAG